MLAFTILDYECPQGWNKLVKRLCDELALALEEKGLLDDYVVLQAKEKYGSLRWYDNCGDPDIEAIVRKYEDESRFTCVICGDLAEWESTGYISPFCNYCIYDEEIYGGKLVPIEEYFHLWG